MTDRADEIARECVEYSAEKGALRIYRGDRLQTLMADALRAYGREVQEGCADEVARWYMSPHNGGHGFLFRSKEDFRREN